MNREKASTVVFCVLTALLALGLGYLWGYNDAPSEFQITIESPEIVTAQAVQEETPEPQGPIDLNTAAQEELEQLPGIGPAIAGRIITYRQKHGPFTAIEQIVNVEGIGEKRFEGMKEFISIGGVQ